MKRVIMMILTLLFYNMENFWGFLSWLLAFSIGCHPILVSGFLVFPCSLWHYYIKKTFYPVVLLGQ